MNCFPDLHVDESVVDEIKAIVLYNYFRRTKMYGETHRLILWHGSIDVEVFDVRRHESSIMC